MSKPKQEDYETYHEYKIALTMWEMYGSWI